MLNLSLLAGGVLSYTAALAWNDAAKAVITSETDNQHARGRALTIYAIIITLVIIIAVWAFEYLARCREKNQKRKVFSADNEDIYYFYKIRGEMGV